MRRIAKNLAVERPLGLPGSLGAAHVYRLFGDDAHLIGTVARKWGLVGDWEGWDTDGNVLVTDAPTRHDAATRLAQCLT